MALPALEIEITADTSAADVGFKKIERSLDGLERATEEYQRALQRVATAERRGVINSRQAAAAIRGAEQAYEQAARSAAAYSNASVTMTRTTAGLTRGFRNLGGGQIQNVAFQVGDFATQVGAGQSASVALGQQLPQLLGGFGALGAVMGAVVAIGVPLVAALVRTEDSAEDATEAIDGMGSSLSSLRESMDLTRFSIDDLEERYGTFTANTLENIERLLRAQIELTRQAASAAVGADLFEGNSALGEAIQQMQRLETATGRTLRGIELSLEGISPAMTEAAQAVIDFTNSSNLSLEEQRDAAQEAAAALEALNDPEYATQIASLSSFADQASQILAIVTQSAARAAGALSAVAGGTLSYEPSDVQGGRSAGVGGPTAEELQRNVPAVQLAYQPGGPAGIPALDFGDGGGGGGGRTNPIIAQLEQLQQSLLSAEELQIQSYERQQQTLEGALQQRLITQQEYARMMEQVEQSHQFAMVRSANDGTRAILGNLETAFQGSKEFGAAIALANSWLSFTEVLKDPSFVGRPFARFAAAAAALSSGLNAVRNIQSASKGGGGAAAGAGAAQATAGQVQQQEAAPIQQQRSLTLIGDRFNRQQAIQIAEFMNDGTDDGLVIRGRR